MVVFMNPKAIARFVLTLLVVGIAAYLGYRLWLNYMDGAWTRDGRVRAIKKICTS
jgi:multidrug resistance efflux pump